MNAPQTNRLGRKSAAIAAAFIGVAGILSGPAARAQQTVITSGGGVTVRNANGTTTRITNGGVITTGRAHKTHVRHSVRRVRVVNLANRPVVGGGQFALSGTNRTLTINAKNGTVAISGNNNTVHVTGTCRRLAVPGNHNLVTADHVAAIDATGNDNRVVWRGGANGNRTPNITQTGSRNTVSRR